MTTRIFWNAHRSVRSTVLLRQYDAIFRIATFSTSSSRLPALHAASICDLVEPFCGQSKTGRTWKPTRDKTRSFASASAPQRLVEEADEGARPGVGKSERFPRICILGGGFGGLYTAIKLESLMWPNGTKPQVTLIDQNDRFVFKPLLYEILEGTAEEVEVAPFFRDLLAPFQTQFLQARVAGVDVSTNPDEGGVIKLEDGSIVPYDWLVVAIGAKTNFRGIPGVQELALPFCSYSDVQKVNEALEEICQDSSEESSHAVVVGAGYAGVELVAALQGKIRRLLKKTGPVGKTVSVSLITDTDFILPTAPASQRSAAEHELKKDNIEVKTGYFVKSITSRNKETGVKIKPTVISLTPDSNGKEAETLQADLVLWTAGSSSAIRDQTFPFETTSFGCVKTEPSLRVVHQKRVFALGDDAVIDSDTSTDMDPLPATAQVALQQADYVSWNLWASINHKPLLSFRYQHLGDMMSLGSQNAAIALPISLPKSINDAIRDSPLLPIAHMFGIDFGDGSTSKDQRPTLEGNTAAVVRRLAYWYRQPTGDQRSKIARAYVDKLSRMITDRSSKN